MTDDRRFDGEFCGVGCPYNVDKWTQCALYNKRLSLWNVDSACYCQHPRRCAACRKEKGEKE